MSHKHLEGTGKVDKPENTGQQEKKGLKGRVEALKDRIAEHAKNKREGTEKKADAKLEKLDAGQQEKKGFKGRIEAIKDRIAEHAKNKREGTDKKPDANLDKDKSKDTSEKKSAREEFLERIKVDKIPEIRPSGDRTDKPDKKSTSTSEGGHGEKYDNSGRDERIPYREAPAKNNEVPKKDDKDLSFREKLKVDLPQSKSFESTSVKPEDKDKKKDNDNELSL